MLVTGMLFFARMLLAAAAYWAMARVGCAFAIPHAFVTLWPPAGLMLALLAVSDRREWASLLAGGIAGSLVSDLSSGYTIPLALVAAVANASESALAAWVLTTRVGTPFRLASVRAVLELA